MLSRKEQEGDPSCVECFGTGHPIKIERHIVRSRVAVTARSLPNLTHVAPLGNLAPDTGFFYFDWRVNPKNKDYIFEAITDSKGYVHGVSDVYLISYVERHRGKNGRIEFIRVAARSQPSLVSLASKTLLSYLRAVRK